MGRFLGYMFISYIFSWFCTVVRLFPEPSPHHLRVATCLSASTDTAVLPRSHPQPALWALVSWVEGKLGTGAPE